MSKQEITQTIIDFIRKIGLRVKQSQIPEKTFVPGIHIEKGVILYDEARLKFPGDLLHEAGHLALMEPEKRGTASGDLEPGDGKKLNSDSLEVGVILWTWAALKYLKLDPEVVFHQEGYRGASDWYIEMFSSGNYTGLPLLQWMELCKRDDDNIEAQPFPHMLKWVRQ